jgi:hypothetical protein
MSYSIISSKESLIMRTAPHSVEGNVRKENSGGHVTPPLITWLRDHINLMMVSCPSGLPSVLHENGKFPICGDVHEVHIGLALVEIREMSDK